MQDGMVLSLAHPLGVVALAVALSAELLVLRSLGDRASAQLFAVSQRSGWHKLVVYPLLAPGVALHETAHALAALSAGVGVSRFVPFWPKREGAGWRFGYVTHGPATVWQTAAIASAPLWLTPAVVYLLGCIMVPAAQLGDGPLELAEAALADLAAPAVIGWLWLAASSALSNFPSDVDVRNMSAALPLVGLACVAAFGFALTSPAASGVLAPFLLLALLLAPPAAVCLLVGLRLGFRRPR